jgi:hypothetical protein
MAFTVQQVIDRARVPLNDAAKSRYSDAELTVYANDAYYLLRRYRSDIFLGQWSALPESLGIDDEFPAVNIMYIPSISDYVTARAEFKDDEAVIAQRAQAMLAMAIAGVRQV